MTCQRGSSSRHSGGQHMTSSECGDFCDAPILLQRLQDRGMVGNVAKGHGDISDISKVYVIRNYVNTVTADNTRKFCL